MNKLYQRINWQNYPSDSTPLNESNLNKMDAAVDGIDDRVVTLDVTKLPVATANTMVKDVTFNETTGVFTITKLNGTKVTVNTALEKIATNFRFDHSTQKLILTLIDGTTQEVDLSALLTQYEFLNSSTIQFTIDSSGKVKASVVNGSITGDMLEPNYLANVTLQASKADTSAKNAKESEEKASEYAESAKNSADSVEPVASTATGINPTIQDSTNAPFIYGKFKGCTEQQMYSGKNIFTEKAEEFSISGSYGVWKIDNYEKELTLSIKSKNDDTSLGLGELNFGWINDPMNPSENKYNWLLANGEIARETSTSSNGERKYLCAYPYTELQTILSVLNIQLEEGATATPYEPYTETTATIPTDAPLYKGDYIEAYADGSGKLVRKMKEIVLNGSNLKLTTWDGFRANGLNYAYLRALDRASNDKQSNSVSSVGISPNFYYEGVVFGLDNSISVVLKDEKTGIVSTDTQEQAVKKINTWLQSNPVTVVYELAEPIETPLTAEQVAQFKQLYTFEPVTNVLCDGEVEMRYYKANDNGKTVGMLQEQTKDFAKKTIYGDTTINVGRKADTTVGDYSSAIGAGTTASGYASLAEGFYTTAENTAAHAEGSSTKASGLNSHAEGNSTNALESNSHAEGYKTIASGLDSHAEGNTTTASGEDSHAEGNNSKAIGAGSHAEGYFTTASGLYSHAEGNSTTASGNNSHAEGQGTKALGDNSHAEGRATQALQNQHAQGHYNDTSLATMNSDSGTSNGTAFVIGNGGVGSLSNAFRITGKGAVYAKEAYNATGADYAEFSEWADGNPNNEDRRGYFVTFDDEKPNMIRKANAGEYILGIVSGNPCIIGNADEGWLGRYVFDDFGGIIYEDKEVEETYIDEETGEEKTRLVQITTYKENPDYDPTQKYIHREQRQEWAAVGWIGLLSVRDDNTCIPSGYCKVTDGGIATAAERGTDTYRVLERVTDNIIKIVLK